MRIALIAAAGACVILAACGGPETSQANNAQANIGNDASPPPTANASTTANSMMMLAAGPVSGAHAVRIMHERHEGMETIGKNNKAIKRQLDGGSPDLAAVRASAAKIADLSQKASGWFPKGTGPDVGKTGAKPEIWQNAQDFSTKLRNFQLAAKAFNSAAASGNVDAIKGKFGELGQACKACHDKYRSEMHH
ncbi:MAG: c-type cytochrome [Sphingomicrobium sp.]